MSYNRYQTTTVADNSFSGAAWEALNGNNNNSNGVTTKYIPTLYAGKLLVKFYESSVLGEIANTDYEGEIQNQGDAVVIRKLPSISVNSHTKGLSLTHENPTVDSVTLEINKGKYWAFATDDIDNVQTDIQNWISEWTAEAAYQLRNEVEKDVLQNIAGSITLKPTTVMDGDTDSNPFLAKATGASLVDHMIDVGSLLDEKNVNEEGRYFLLPPELIAFIKKGDLGDANKSGDATSMKRNGVVGQIDRFTIYRTNNLTKITNGGSGGNTVYTCLFGHPVGLTFATQLLKSEMLQNPDGFGMLHRGLQVYGFKVVQTDAIGLSFISPDATLA